MQGGEGRSTWDRKAGSRSWGSLKAAPSNISYIHDINAGAGGGEEGRGMGGLFFEGT